jgi:hypothetical protein
LGFMMVQGKGRHSVPLVFHCLCASLPPLFFIQQKLGSAGCWLVSAAKPLGRSTPERPTALQPPPLGPLPERAGRCTHGCTAGAPLSGGSLPVARLTYQAELPCCPQTATGAGGRKARRRGLGSSARCSTAPATRSRPSRTSRAACRAPSRAAVRPTRRCQEPGVVAPAAVALPCLHLLA